MKACYATNLIVIYYIPRIGWHSQTLNSSNPMVAGGKAIAFPAGRRDPPGHHAPSTLMIQVTSDGRVWLARVSAPWRGIRVIVAFYFSYSGFPLAFYSSRLWTPFGFSASCSCKSFVVSAFVGAVFSQEGRRQRCPCRTGSRPTQQPRGQGPA